MAIAFRNESQVIGTGTSVTGTEPTGTVQNDVLVAMYIVDSASATLNIPAGWTSIYNGSSVNPQFKYNLCYIARGASAPSLAFTHTGSVYRELFILSFSGVDTANPINAQADGGSARGIGLTPDPPAITTTVANTVVLACAVTWAGADIGGYTVPSGYTARTSNANNDSGVIATKSLATATTENPGAFTNTNTGATNDDWKSTVALSPLVVTTSMSINNNATGGTNGTTVTTGNSGGASGTAWNTVNVGTGGNTVTFSTSQKAIGTTGYKVATTGTADVGFVTWSTALTPGLTMYERGYFYFASSPVSIFRIMQLTNSSFSSCGGVGTTALSKFKLLDSTATLVATSSTTVPQNQWIRLELMVFSDASVGQMELRIFLNPHSATPDETVTTAATINTRGGNIGGVVYGVDVAIANLTMYMDNLVVTDIGYPKPDVPTPSFAWYGV